MSQPLSSDPTNRRPESRVRDHLANERTFLAWIRTALGLIGVGFVLARMGLFLGQLAPGGGVSPPTNTPGRPAEFLITGFGFLLFGLAVAIGSGWSYQRSCRAIDLGVYEPPRATVATLTIAVALGGLIVAALVLRQLLTSGAI